MRGRRRKEKRSKEELEKLISDMLEHAKMCRKVVDEMTNIVHRVADLLKRFDEKVENGRKLIKDVEKYVDEGVGLIKGYDEVLKSYRVVRKRAVEMLKIVRSLTASMGMGELIGGLRELLERNDAEALSVIRSEKYAELMELINSAFGKRDERYHSGTIVDGSLLERLEEIKRIVENEFSKIDNRAT